MASGPVAVVLDAAVRGGLVPRVRRGRRLVRCSSFGLLEERRLVRADGLVVEVCVGLPAWAATDPVDPGTAAVVAGGLRVLWDPSGLLHRLLGALAPS
jgi:hypothetical protein